MKRKISATNRTTIARSAPAIARRLNDGIAACRAQLVDIAGITAAEADKVIAFHFRKRIAKRDLISDRVTVVRGGFLDAGVIRRAVARYFLNP